MRGVTAMGIDNLRGLARAGTPDARRIAGLVARAFQDDPLMRYAIPDARQRRRLLPTLMCLNARYGCRYGSSVASSEKRGLWSSRCLP